MSEQEQSNLDLSENAARAVDPVPSAAPDELFRMRVQVVGLGISFLILSLSFSAFVLKQNRVLKANVDARADQVKKIAEFVKQWTPTMNELAGYSLNNSEGSAIFARYGLQISQNPPAK